MKLLSWFLDCFPKINPKSHWRTYASGWYELPRLLYCPWLQLILNRSGVLSGPGLITLWIIHRSISMGDHDPCILTDGVPGTGYTGYSCPPTAASPLCHSGLRNLPRSLHSKICRTVKSLQSCLHSFVTSICHFVTILWWSKSCEIPQYQCISRLLPSFCGDLGSRRVHCALWYFTWFWS